MTRDSSGWVKYSTNPAGFGPFCLFWDSQDNWVGSVEWQLLYWLCDSSEHLVLPVDCCVFCENFFLETYCVQICLYQAEVELIICSETDVNQPFK